MKLQILIFLLITNSCHSQENSRYKIEKDYFLIGTISDYMGRFKDPLDTMNVDSYYENERPLLDFNYALFKKDYGDLKKDSLNKKLESAKLLKKINSYFNWVYDPNWSNKNHDSLYIGYVDLKKIQTETQKSSFLLGVYTRYGQKNDSTYCINISSSNTLFDTSLKILKDLKCRKVESKIYEGIPVSCVIYFQPTDRLKMYLDYYGSLRRKIWDKEK
ncbi:MAG: hypothetical protein QM710_13770 [Flavobacterium sp.]